MGTCFKKYMALLIIMLISLRNSVNLLFPPLTNVPLQFSQFLFQGPRAKMEEAGLHLPARLAGALYAPALSGSLSASWELESFFSSALPVCYLPHLRA